MSQPHDPAKPTATQLRYLRQLAQITGETFTYPLTRAEASAQITRLTGRPANGRVDDVIDRYRQLHGYLPDATCHTADEVDGYGSDARWTHRRPEGER